MAVIKNDNFVTIQGWMINELNLSNNELIVYAAIYGFSQTDNNAYNGSREYLSGWTNGTVRGIQKNLNQLVEKGYIEKTEKRINGVKFCEYIAVPRSSLGRNKVPLGGEQSSLGVGNKVPLGREQSSHNNIQDTILDNIDNNIVEKILSHLNNKAGSNYKSSSKKTQALITARINEGFELNDFLKVIDIKCDEWLSNKKMRPYLRPETLFSNKFESYLNQGELKNAKDTGDYSDLDDRFGKL